MILPFAISVLVLGSVAYISAAPTALVGAPSIHDGDTIAMQGYRIRLYGIDAEELSEPHGAKAKWGLASMIVASHLPIRCERMPGVTHGRIVAECFTSTGVNINAEMVRKGYALDCARYSRGKYRALEPVGVRLKLIQKRYC